MKVKRALLIVPPAITYKYNRDINPLPPMGLGYLASVIEDMGIEVKIVDCLVHGYNDEHEINDMHIRVGLGYNVIKDIIKDFDPDIVGINCQFSRNYKIYHETFGLIKEVKPKCITIGGGAHATVCPEEVLSDPNCDFIIVGEAEESLKSLLLAIMHKTEMTSVDGLGWKSNGNLNINNKTKWIHDLDLIKFPAYHLMHLENYFGHKLSHGRRHRDKFSPIITSRGCPARCTFCSAKAVWGFQYRMRSVDNIIKEMELLRTQYGIEEIMFEDDNVTANPKRARELFSRMIEEGFNFEWDTPNGVGVWSLDENLLYLMKQSGCRNLNFPIESGSQYVLNNIIKKPLNLDKVKQLIECCKKINLSYGIFLVIGMPGERIEDIWKSFLFAAECGCYNPHISVATPYPGTELFNICVKNGYFSKQFTLDDLFIRSFLIRTPDWGERDLRRTLFLGDLYFRYHSALKDPGQFIKWIIKKIKAPHEIKEYLNKTIFQGRSS